MRSHAPHGVTLLAGNLAGVVTPVIPSEGNRALPLPLDDDPLGRGAHHLSGSQSACDTGPYNGSDTTDIGGSVRCAAPGSGSGILSGTDSISPGSVALPGSRWSDAPDDQCDVAPGHPMFDYDELDAADEG